MDTRKCQVLLKVLECGSMAGAAEVFGYDPSGISRMIASMERETGFALLVRGKNGISLTKGGERLLPVIPLMVKCPRILGPIALENRMRSRPSLSCAGL